MPPAAIIADDTRTPHPAFSCLTVPPLLLSHAPPPQRVGFRRPLSFRPHHCLAPAAVLVLLFLFPRPLVCILVAGRASENAGRVGNAPWLHKKPRFVRGALGEAGARWWWAYRGRYFRFGGIAARQSNHQAQAVQLMAISSRHIFEPQPAPGWGTGAKIIVIVIKSYKEHSGGDCGCSHSLRLPLLSLPPALLCCVCPARPPLARSRWLPSDQR